MKVPEHITGEWMDSLTDGDLLVAESSLRKSFFNLEREEKKRDGAQYELMRGSAELLAAWSRWSRVSTETRTRGLHPRWKQLA